MSKFVIYCKSYINDLARVKVLTESVNKYNVDNIPFYISCPNDDYQSFKNNIPEFANIIRDEDIVNKVYSQSWSNQQIVKSEFWKYVNTENYLCIDSDSYFIKPFRLSDFMYNDTTPYTVMHEQKELFSWASPKVNELGFNPKDAFQKDRKKIMDLFNRTSRYYDFGPSPAIWSSAVWKSLEDNYINPNNLTFENLIEYSQSEFSWYGEALLAFKAIDIYSIEPIFKVFHYPAQLIEYKQQGITELMIADNYMGIIMTSNWNAPLRY